MFGKKEMKAPIAPAGLQKPRDGLHCDLCGCSSPAVRCDKCNSQKFCLSCDDMYHRHPKRKSHVRKAVDSITSALRPPSGTRVEGDPSSMPIPPPRKKKSRSIFSAFSKPGHAHLEEQHPELPKKEFSWTDKFGSIKRFMASRPLPPVPKDDDVSSQLPPLLPREPPGTNYVNVDSTPPQRPPPRPAFTYGKENRSDTFSRPTAADISQHQDFRNPRQVPVAERLSTLEDWDDIPSVSGSTKESRSGDEAWNQEPPFPRHHLPSYRDTMQNDQAQNFNMPGFGTLRDQQLLHRMMTSGRNERGTLGRQAHQSSSMADLHSFGPHVPGHPMMHPPPMFPFPTHGPPFHHPPFPYPPYGIHQSMIHLNYPHGQGPVPPAGGSWSNINSPAMDRKDLSGQRDDKPPSRYPTLDSKIKRSHSMMHDTMMHPGPFYPFGFPGYPPFIPPWIHSSNPPSPSLSHHSLPTEEKMKEADEGRPHQRKVKKKPTKQFLLRSSGEEEEESEELMSAPEEVSVKDTEAPPIASKKKTSIPKTRKISRKEDLRRETSSPSQRDSPILRHRTSDHHEQPCQGRVNSPRTVPPASEHSSRVPEVPKKENIPTRGEALMHGASRLSAETVHNRLSTAERAGHVAAKEQITKSEVAYVDEEVREKKVALPQYDSKLPEPARPKWDPTKSWECPFCTFINEPGVKICIVCCKTGAREPTPPSETALLLEKRTGLQDRFPVEELEEQAKCEAAEVDNAFKEYRPKEEAVPGTPQDITRMRQDHNFPGPSAGSLPEETASEAQHVKISHSLQSANVDTRDLPVSNAVSAEQPIVSAPPVPEILKPKKPKWDPTKPWECEHCTFINEPGEKICVICCKTSYREPTPPGDYELPTTKRIEFQDTLASSSVEVGNEEVKEDIEKEQEKGSQRSEDKKLQEGRTATAAAEEKVPAPVKTLTESSSITLTKEVHQSESKEISSNANDVQAQPRDVQKPNDTKKVVTTGVGTDTEDLIIESFAKAPSPVSKTSPGPSAASSAILSTDASTSPIQERKTLVQMSTPASSMLAQKRLTRQSSEQGEQKMTRIGNLIRSLSKTSLHGDMSPEVGGPLYRSGSRHSVISESGVPESPFGGNKAPVRYGSLADFRGSQLGGTLPVTSERITEDKKKLDYYLSLEELVERQRQETMRTQGLELVRLIREAEQQGFTADDLQVAMNQCGNNNPISWLKENWKNMTETVVTLATNYGHDRRENNIGMISPAEAQEALRHQKGNIWAAVTDCVESRQRKFMELSSRGNFSRQEILTALTDHQGNLDLAYAQLTKATLKPFLMRIWGAGSGVDNDEGAARTDETVNDRVKDWLESSQFHLKGVENADRASSSSESNHISLQDSQADSGSERARSSSPASSSYSSHKETSDISSISSAAQGKESSTLDSCTSSRLEAILKRREAQKQMEKGRKTRMRKERETTQTKRWTLSSVFKSKQTVDDSLKLSQSSLELENELENEDSKESSGVKEVSDSSSTLRSGSSKTKDESEAIEVPADFKESISTSEPKSFLGKLSAFRKDIMKINKKTPEKGSGSPGLKKKEVAKEEIYGSAKIGATVAEESLGLKNKSLISEVKEEQEPQKRATQRPLQMPSPSKTSKEENQCLTSEVCIQDGTSKELPVASKDVFVETRDLKTDEQTPEVKVSKNESSAEKPSFISKLFRSKKDNGTSNKKSAESLYSSVTQKSLAAEVQNNLISDTTEPITAEKSLSSVSNQSLESKDGQETKIQTETDQTKHSIYISNSLKVKNQTELPFIEQEDSITISTEKQKLNAESSKKGSSPKSSKQGMLSSVIAKEDHFGSEDVSHRAESKDSFKPEAMKSDSVKSRFMPSLKSDETKDANLKSESKASKENSLMTESNISVKTGEINDTSLKSELKTTMKPDDTKDSSLKPESKPSVKPDETKGSSPKPESKPSMKPDETKVSSLKPESKPSVKAYETKGSSPRPESKLCIKPDKIKGSSLKPESKPSVKQDKTKASSPKPEPKPSVKPDETKGSSPKPESKPSVKPDETKGSSPKPESKPSMKPDETEASSPKSKCKLSMKPDETKGSSLKPESKPSVKPDETKGSSPKPESKPSVKPNETKGSSPKLDSKPFMKPDETKVSSLKPESKPDETEGSSPRPESKLCIKPDEIKDSSLKPESKPSVKPDETKGYSPKPESKPSLKPDETEVSSPKSKCELSMKPDETEGSSLKPESKLSGKPDETKGFSLKPESKSSVKSDATKDSSAKPESKTSLKTGESKSTSPKSQPKTSPKSVGEKYAGLKQESEITGEPREVEISSLKPESKTLVKSEEQKEIMQEELKVIDEKKSQEKTLLETLKTAAGDKEVCDSVNGTSKIERKEAKPKGAGSKEAISTSDDKVSKKEKEPSPVQEKQTTSSADKTAISEEKANKSKSADQNSGTKVNVETASAFPKDSKPNLADVTSRKPDFTETQEKKDSEEVLELSLHVKAKEEISKETKSEETEAKSEKTEKLEVKKPEAKEQPDVETKKQAKEKATKSSEKDTSSLAIKPLVKETTGSLDSECKLMQPAEKDPSLESKFSAVSNREEKLKDVSNKGVGTAQKKSDSLVSSAEEKLQKSEVSVDDKAKVSPALKEEAVVKVSGDEKKEFIHISKTKVNSSVKVETTPVMNTKPQMGVESSNDTLTVCEEKAMFIADTSKTTPLAATEASALKKKIIEAKQQQDSQTVNKKVELPEKKESLSAVPEKHDTRVDSESVEKTSVTCTIPAEKKDSNETVSAEKKQTIDTVSAGVKEISGSIQSDKKENGDTAKLSDKKDTGDLALEQMKVSSIDSMSVGEKESDISKAPQKKEANDSVSPEKAKKKIKTEKTVKKDSLALEGHVPEATKIEKPSFITEAKQESSIKIDETKEIASKKLMPDSIQDAFVTSQVNDQMASNQDMEIRKEESDEQLAKSNKIVKTSKHAEENNHIYEEINVQSENTSEQEADEKCADNLKRKAKSPAKKSSAVEEPSSDKPSKISKEPQKKTLENIKSSLDESESSKLVAASKVSSEDVKPQSTKSSDQKENKETKTTKTSKEIGKPSSKIESDEISAKAKVKETKLATKEKSPALSRLGEKADTEKVATTDKKVTTAIEQPDEDVPKEFAKTDKSKEITTENKTESGSEGTIRTRRSRPVSQTSDDETFSETISSRRVRRVRETTSTIQSAVRRRERPKSQVESSDAPSDLESTDTESVITRPPTGRRQSLRRRRSQDLSTTEGGIRTRERTEERRRPSLTKMYLTGRRSDGSLIVVKPQKPGDGLRRGSLTKTGMIPRSVAANIAKLRSCPPPVKRKQVILPKAVGVTNEKQREYEEKANKFVQDGKCTTMFRGKLAAELIDMSFEDEDAFLAAQECDNIYQAVNFLQHECELCAANYPISHMVSMLHCTHRACKECLAAYFTIQIRDRNIMELLCPFCNEPDLSDEDTELNYFNHMDTLLKNLVAPEVYELFQSKLRDRALMKDPNFRWCSQCCSGFITIPNQKRLICPDCNVVTCAQCRRPWEKQHEGISCDQFQEWKEANDPDFQAVGLAQHLAENGIDCPNCRFRYSLSKGGCMHFRCYQCGYDFCSGCNMPFKMGEKCGHSPFCAKLGLHAHHPRNCLFYLRDKDIADLQRLLKDHDTPFNSETIKAYKFCQVPEQKESTLGLKDEICGRDVEEGTAGLCRKHYIEYLGQLIFKHLIDPLPILDLDELEMVIKRANMCLPSRYRITDEQYKERLTKIIQTELPLDKLDGRDNAS